MITKLDRNDILIARMLRHDGTVMPYIDLHHYAHDDFMHGIQIMMPKSFRRVQLTLF